MCSAFRFLYAPLGNAQRGSRKRSYEDGCAPGWTEKRNNGVPWDRERIVDVSVSPGRLQDRILRGCPRKNIILLFTQIGRAHV